MRDIRYAFRVLLKNPAFTALAIVTLALGIGANTAIFTVANSVLLRPLPFKDPSQLVRISTDREGTGVLSLPYFTLLSGTNHSFSGVTAYQRDVVNLIGRDGAEEIQAERVTWNFFDVLGATPVAGRTFTSDEDQPGGIQTVLIGAELAARLFGGEQNAVGRIVSLDSKDYTIIGVLPVRFGVQLLGRKAEVWMTRIIELSMVTPARANIGGMYYDAIGRLRPGVSSAQTRSMMLLIGVFSATALILAVVGIYGVIAYSVAQRTQELGIRIALGASDTDILMLVVGNGFRLAAVGILMGVATSFGLTRLMASLLYRTSATDLLTFAGSAVVFAAVAALASYIPARRAMRINPTDALRSA